MQAFTDTGRYRGDVSSLRSTRLIVRAILAAVFCLPLVTGCGKENSTKVVYGTVTYAGESVETGQLRFVPVDGTPGPASLAKIANGEFRIARFPSSDRGTWFWSKRVYFDRGQNNDRQIIPLRLFEM